MPRYMDYPYRNESTGWRYTKPTDIINNPNASGLWDDDREILAIREANRQHEIDEYERSGHIWPYDDQTRPYGIYISYDIKNKPQKHSCSYSVYLICGNLNAPIEQAIGKEKLQELLKAWKPKHEGKIAKGVFSVRFRDIS